VVVVNSGAVKNSSTGCAALGVGANREAGRAARVGRIQSLLRLMGREDFKKEA
jgi:hypothetical protein